MPQTPPDRAPRNEQAASNRGGRRIGAALAIAALFLAAGVLANPGALHARYQAKAEPTGQETFVKVGKTYINLNMITHVIDDPGYNNPPGTIQVYVTGAAQNYFNLYGDQAEALRQVLNGVSVDHSPKDSAAPAKAGAPPAKKVTVPKKPALVPSTDPG